MKKNQKIRLYITLIICVGLYIVLFKSYIDGSICTASGSFLIVSLLYWLSFVILSIRQCRDRMIKKYQGLRYSNVVVFFIIPLMAFYVVEVIFNSNFSTIPFVKVLVNYFMFIGLQIGILLISHSYRFAYTSVLSLAWIFGVVNYYVMKFKGNPLLPGDLLSYKTAMSVVGNYTFELSDSIVYGCLLFLYGICVIKCFTDVRKHYSLKHKLTMFILGAFWLYSLGSLLFNIKWTEKMNIYIDTWAPENTYYQNGATFAFLMEVQAMHIDKPEGYSVSEVVEILNTYCEDEFLEGENINPSVIVIMNESFSDLRVFGEFESENVLINMDNLKSFMMKGNAYVSINGGGTCNSEFEFLTGISMANFAGSSIVPYQTYNLGNVPNLVALFAEKGYETLAIHPAEANNWERERAYQQLGFDDFISLEDLNDVQKIRGYASDVYNYQQIINAYEKKDSPLFLFNVTMQNHGGYATDISELDLIDIEEKYQSYGETINYLTLMKESDRAFAELLDYFSKVDEPVIVCMFGDHQPVFNNNFISDLRGGDSQGLAEFQKNYVTPYVIWCNYDAEIQNINKDMSLNYLGATVSKLAGVDNAYIEYLLNLQEDIPIINRNGYKTSEGEWFGINEFNTLIDEYSKIQYYQLFDNK